VTTWPTAVTVEGVADFTTEIAGAGGAVTIALDGCDVTEPPVGDVPDAVAVFVTAPAFTSACVITYVAVHVTDAPGSNDGVAGQLGVDIVPEPEKAPSVTVGFDRVMLPVLVTTNEYVTVCPTALTVTGDADFNNEIDGVCGAGIVTCDGGDVTVEPVGDVPDEVALFVMLPASTSA
jgi:hypothetical protein